jgi:hypothetical protein
MEGRSRRGSGVGCVLLVSAALAACGDGDHEPREARADAGGAATTAAAAFPTSEQLCALSPSASDESELRAVFGEPTQVHQGEGRVLRYTFADESRWLFFIDEQGIWSGYTVQGGVSGDSAIPECWVPDGGFWQRDGGYWERPDGGYRERSDAGWR